MRISTYKEFRHMHQGLVLYIAVPQTYFGLYTIEKL